MPVRMTGMISGLDTESLIQGMVDAQKLKYKKVEDNKTLLEWKQDKWKELNTKLYKLYTDDLNKMRLENSYMTKKVTSSNDNLVSVVGKSNAPEGSHSINISQLASSQYVTGGVISQTDVNGQPVKVASTTKLVDLGVDKETLLNITTNGETKTLEVTDKTTIADFVAFGKTAGVSINFDANQSRIFVSSKKSGTENAFQITATKSTATTPKNEILDLVGYKSLNAVEKQSVDNALTILATKTDTDPETADAKLVLQNLAEKEAKRKIASNVDAEIRSEVSDGARLAEEDNIRAEVMQQQLELLKEEARKEGKTQEEVDAITEDSLTTEQRTAITEAQDKKISESTTRINAAVEKAVSEAITAEKEKEAPNRYTIAESSTEGQVAITAASNDVTLKAEAYQTNSKTVQTEVGGELQELGLDALKEDGTIKDPVNKVSTLIAAEDSKITYNGVEFTNSSNVVNVNGLEISLKGTSNGETINLNVTNDTQAVYEMVKKFITSYNDILKEMNTLYYAPSVRGYDPLSDEEREVMTEGQIDKWETKIKDSILRRDSSLGTLLDSMKHTMTASKVDVNGTSYSLSSFGIQTSSDYTEKGLLHIFGNSDDSTYAVKENKLMKALEEDPDTVIDVFTKISQKLYDTMFDKMKSVPNVRSAFTFYNDKTMANEMKDYTKKISQNEKKLKTLENKYYKQFAAMETAMAKLQSQSNALAGMLGMPTK